MPGGCPQQPALIGGSHGGGRGLDRALIKVRETSPWTEVRVKERLQGTDPRIGLLRCCSHACVRSVESIVKGNSGSKVPTHCPSAFRQDPLR